MALYDGLRRDYQVSLVLSVRRKIWDSATSYWTLSDSHAARTKQPPEQGAPAGASADSPTDEELVARARKKDFAAFEELLDRYEDKVFRLAYRFVRNETDAKEILQDTFLSIWR